MDNALHRVLSVARTKYEHHHQALNRLSERAARLDKGRARTTTAGEILELSELQIMEKFDVCMPDADLLLRIVSEALLPSICTVTELAHRGQGQDGFEASAARDFTATDIAALDKGLRGGLRSGQITELVGRAGTGKTQFCITLSVLVALRERGVLYFDTERKFSPQRLVEIARARLSGNGDDSQQAFVRRAAGRVRVMVCQSCDELLRKLFDVEDAMISDDVGLVVVDSIAALARNEYAAGSARGGHGSHRGGVSASDGVVARQKMLARQASQLKYIAETFHVPVLVTNQVGAVSSALTPRDCVGGPGVVSSAAAKLHGISKADFGRFEESSVGGVSTAVSEPAYAHFAPALGNTWSHCVNVRIALERHDTEATLPRRRARVVKSPSSPCFECEFEIRASGVVQESVPISARISLA